MLASLASKADATSLCMNVKSQLEIYCTWHSNGPCYPLIFSGTSFWDPQTTVAWFQSCDIILLEVFITERDRHHVRVQLVLNDTYIIWTFHGVFYHNQLSQKCPWEHPHAIILPLLACLRFPVHVSSSWSTGRRYTLMMPSTWWTRNHDLSD